METLPVPPSLMAALLLSVVGVQFLTMATRPKGAFVSLEYWLPVCGPFLGEE